MNFVKEYQWGQVLLLQENLFRIFNMSSWITCLTRATRLRPASQHQHIFYVINVLPCPAPLSSAQWSELLSKYYFFILLRILRFHEFTRCWQRIHFTNQHVCNRYAYRNYLNFQKCYQPIVLCFAWLRARVSLLRSLAHNSKTKREREFEFAFEGETTHYLWLCPTNSNSALVGCCSEQILGSIH